MISLITLPLITCIILVFIHVYFGSFVLKRGIIFIDLALAQWAALGYLIGILFHVESPFILFCIGFGFTLFASAFLTLTQPIFKKGNLHEALIGVTYIAAITIATAIISSTQIEPHHLKDMLAGHLLFLEPYEVISAAVIYFFISMILLKIHSFLSSSQSKFRDFVFYVLFGLVVTSSVKMVGVLLVFSFLVLPLLTVTLHSSKLRLQLYFSWAIGIIGSIAGLLFSFILDIPPSFCIILALLCFFLLNIIIYLIKNKST